MSQKVPGLQVVISRVERGKKLLVARSARIKERGQEGYRRSMIAEAGLAITFDYFSMIIYGRK